MGGTVRDHLRRRPCRWTLESKAPNIRRCYNLLQAWALRCFCASEHGPAQLPTVVQQLVQAPWDRAFTACHLPGDAGSWQGLISAPSSATRCRADHSRQEKLGQNQLANPLRIVSRCRLCRYDCEGCRLAISLSAIWPTSETS